MNKFEGLHCQQDCHKPCYRTLSHFLSNKNVIGAILLQKSNTSESDFITAMVMIVTEAHASQ